MTFTCELSIGSQAEMRMLAECVVIKCRPGDVIALDGDLGVGKTTFARALIQAALADPAAEVPSPSFAIMQNYDCPRFPIHHFDLYRIVEPEELIEIGFDDPREDALTLIEWPEKAAHLRPTPHIEIAIRDTGTGPEARTVRLTACAPAAARIARVPPTLDLIAQTFAEVDADAMSLGYLQGDASARTYERLAGPFGSRIVMDFPRQPDGPPIRDGLAYSKIAHLAEDIAPFLAIGDTLRRNGFSAPNLDAADIDAGLAIFEDLGDTVFTSEIAAGHDQRERWRSAVDVLLASHAIDWPEIARSDSGLTHTLPRYDRSAMQIEVELLVDWYVTWLTGEPLTPEPHDAFIAEWRVALDALAADRPTWVLRDYHSPNLIWLPERDGVRNVGLLDFQDAQIGHPAYDLVSLTQDARVEVAPDLEAVLLDHYIAQARTRQSGFDETAFRHAYALLGAQRNTKILGIFTRLAIRDGKPQYLQHIPRIRAYLARNLGHPALSGLKRWYDAHLPAKH
jgi:tRNA threonylcarbamoyl adenosine modification protein YjeE